MRYSVHYSASDNEGEKIMSKAEMDEWVANYVRDNATGEEIVTGWVISISMRHPGMNNADGYVVEHSDGLPYHSQLGLLMAALDEKKNTVLAQIVNEEEL